MAEGDGRTAGGRIGEWLAAGYVAVKGGRQRGGRRYLIALRPEGVSGNVTTAKGLIHPRGVAKIVALTDDECWMLAETGSSLPCRPITERVAKDAIVKLADQMRYGSPITQAATGAFVAAKHLASRDQIRRYEDWCRRTGRMA